jgi:hypothetical protein
VLDLVEEALGQVTAAVERWVDRALALAVAAGRDVSAPALGGDEVQQGVGIVAAIGDEVAAANKALRRAGATALSEA